MNGHFWNYTKWPILERHATPTFRWKTNKNQFFFEITKIDRNFKMFALFLCLLLKHLSSGLFNQVYIQNFRKIGLKLLLLERFTKCQWVKNYLVVISEKPLRSSMAADYSNRCIFHIINRLIVLLTLLQMFSIDH